MMTKNKKKGWLVILLDKPAIHWYCRYSDGRVRTGSGTDALPLPKEVDTLLLLPAEDLFLMKVQAGTRHAKAWQLEPYLTVDIETLHLAELMPDGDRRLMAAIDPSLLQSAIRQVNRLGYTPLRVLPDVVAVPAGSAFWWRARWLIHTPGGEYLSLNEQAWQTLAPINAELSALECGKEKVLERLAEGAMRYRATLVRPENRPVRKPLFSAGASLLLLVASLFMEPLWLGWQAERAVKGITQQVLQRYQHYFPHESPSDPLRQFSQKALAYEEQVQPTGLLAVLEKSAPMLLQLKSNPLQNLSWDSTRQQLQLTFAQPVIPSILTAVPEGIQATRQHNQLILGPK